SLPERVAREVDHLGPPAVGPDGHRVPAHVPHHGVVVERPTSEISFRLVAPDLADVPDVYETSPVVAQQHGRVPTHAVVERAGADDGQSIALEILEGHHV